MACKSDNTNKVSQIIASTTILLSQEFVHDRIDVIRLRGRRISRAFVESSDAAVLIGINWDARLSIVNNMRPGRDHIHGQSR